MNQSEQYQLMVPESILQEQIEGFKPSNLFVYEVNDATFGTTPVLLDSGINTECYEDSPFVDSQGFMYRSSSKNPEFPKGVSNIYRINFSSLDLD